MWQIDSNRIRIMSLLNKILAYTINLLCSMPSTPTSSDIDENTIINIEGRVVVGKTFRCELCFIFQVGCWLMYSKTFLLLINAHQISKTSTGNFYCIPQFNTMFSKKFYMLQEIDC